MKFPHIFRASYVMIIPHISIARSNSMKYMMYRFYFCKRFLFCNIWFIENQSLVQKQYSLSFFCYVIRISRLATPKRRLKILIYLSLDHLMFSCPFVPHEQMIYFIYVFHLFHLKAFSQSYSTGLWCKLIHNNLLLLFFCFWTLLLLPTQILIALTLFFLDSFANIILKTTFYEIVGNSEF